MPSIDIVSTKDSKLKGLKVLVYGASGVGKTSLIKTLPDPIIISSEDGLLSLADEDIPAIEIHNEADFRNALKYCRSKDFDYQTVCLDSLTDIAEVILSEHKSLSKDGRQAYGMTNDTVFQFIRDFKKLNCHVYFTAQQEIVEINNVDMTRPNMPGKTLTSGLPYFFDEVFWMSSNRKGERTLLTEQTATKIAKDRSGKLAKEIPADIGLVISTLTQN